LHAADAPQGIQSEGEQTDHGSCSDMFCHGCVALAATQSDVRGRSNRARLWLPLDVRSVGNSGTPTHRPPIFAHA
jgi:hypothetical protein